LADRLKALPPYLFVQIDELKKAMLAKGVDVVDLGIGDPDTPTPGPVVEACARAARDPANHQYPTNWGLAEFREAAAAWMRDRYGVACDPAGVLPVLGSKEAIGHMPLAFVNPGDVVLVPDPCYPVYRSATILADAAYHSIPLVEKNAVEFAKANDIIVVHDAAYLEVAYDGYKPPSFLAVEGAGDVGVEFHSLSKTFNMTGWRIGWATGNAEIVAGLMKVKSNIDSGMFQALQLCAVEALRGDLSLWRAELTALYAERRDILCDGLNAMGWRVEKPKASFYVWARVPEGMTSADAAAGLLEQGGVVVIPGNGYGDAGEGYVRMSLTLATERIKEAVRRIGPVYRRWQSK
jgi:LL-diaminopimelate aminotransferase